MVSVRLEGLTKYFEKVKAVEDVNLNVRDGEFLSLLGPSGCGKTTVLRCIAGLETPTSGHIYFDEKLVNDLSPRERNVAMVFQSYALYSHMTVYDNIAFPLKIRNMPKGEIDLKVKEIAELRIQRILNRKPGEISGGERQRVALGRALVRKPTLFLMDEPLSNLDAKLRVYMRAELKALHQNLKITTIYVTHDQVEAMTMADRIAILNEGKLQQVGTPDELYSKPVNTFVAGFVGSPPMNMIEGTLREHEEKLYFETEDFKLDLTSLKDVLQPHVGADLILGVRPQDITICKGPEKGDAEAKVYVVEPMGDETIIDLYVGKSLFKIRVFQPLWKPEETVWLRFDRERIHLFDKKTGRAIV
ncbi:MAG: ABC transporter ATP-binding protein [Thermoproteota archaeon]